MQWWQGDFEGLKRYVPLILEWRATVDQLPKRKVDGG